MEDQENDINSRILESSDINSKLRKDYKKLSWYDESRMLNRN